MELFVKPGRLEGGRTFCPAGMADIDDFETLAIPHMTTVYRAALALSGRTDQAEDLTQTTFLKAFRRFGSFRPGTSCRAWLLRILKNSWIDTLRHRKVTGKAVHVEEDQIADRKEVEQTTWTNASDLLENFSDAQVIKALGELPDDQRLTLFLVDVEEMTHIEVANVTGVAVGTVKSRSSRARAALRDRLEAYAKDMGLTGRDAE